jgi:hypothetical protein
MASSNRSRRGHSGSRHGKGKGKSVAGRIFLSLLGLVTLFLVVAVFLPSRCRLDRDVLVNATPGVILPQIANLKQWPEWTVWNRGSDASLSISYAGPAEGAGAKSSWSGNKAGTGSMTITENNPTNGIKYELTLLNGNFHASGTISFEPEHDGTRLFWSIDGGLGMNPITRYQGLMLKRKFSQDMELSLQRLKTRVETSKARSAP